MDSSQTVGPNDTRARRAALQRGRLGEAAAVTYLTDAGYQIIERNYRMYRGEIDIIALDGEALVFVEVKTRLERDAADPLESVSVRKMQRVKAAATHYLYIKDLEEALCRFDILCVILTDAEPRIEQLKDVVDF